jgi:hypothetical protein
VPSMGRSGAGSFPSSWFVHGQVGPGGESSLSLLGLADNILDLDDTWTRRFWRRYFELVFFLLLRRVCHPLDRERIDVYLQVVAGIPLCVAVRRRMPVGLVFLFSHLVAPWLWQGLSGAVYELSMVTVSQSLSPEPNSVEQAMTSWSETLTEPSVCSALAFCPSDFSSTGPDLEEASWLEVIRHWFYREAGLILSDITMSFFSMQPRELGIYVCDLFCQ